MRSESVPLLEIRDLGVDYPDHPGALRGVNLELHRGELVVLVGPNGAGKSTLLRAVAGQLPPSQGEVRVAGRPLASPGRAADRALQVAYLPQTLRAEVPFCVRDVVAMGRFAHGPGRLFETPADREAVSEVLAQLDLLPLASRPLSRLSGGERQRVHLARVLCQRAPLLLLDEPATGLDPGHQIDVLDRVRERIRSAEAGALLTVHDLSLAARIADRVAVLAGGRLLAQGPVEAMLAPEVLRPAFGVDFAVGEAGGQRFVLPLRLAPGGGLGEGGGSADGASR